MTKRHRVLTDSWNITVEDVDGLPFVHASVSRWTPRTARAFRAKLDRTLIEHGPPLFALAGTPHGGDHMKLDKFVHRMGFAYHSVVVLRGRPRVLYVRWS